MSTNPLLRGLRPMHPGELLREIVVPAMGKSKTEIARLLGVSRQTLYDIIAERQPITPAMAVRIGKLCGNGPELWLALQQTFDLGKATREVDVSKIPTLQEKDVTSAAHVRPPRAPSASRRASPARARAAA